MSGTTGPVVLLEGVSDVTAVRAAAATGGLDLCATRLVDMAELTSELAVAELPEPLRLLLDRLR